MAVTVQNIYDALDHLAPFETQMSFDNAGFLVGRGSREVQRILVALDITPEVVVEAGEMDAQLIVSHHPVIFQPVRALTDRDRTGEILLSLAERGIAAICAHTNLDAAQDGVNDCLARVLELNQVQLLTLDGTDRQGRTYGIGRIGAAHTKGLSAGAYATFVKERLGAADVRYVDTGRPVERVAVGGGSCGSMLQDAARQGCDTFVTADVKYDVYLEARWLGINLMDAGHYSTEQVVCPMLVRALGSAFPDTKIRLSQCHDQPYGSV